MKAALTERGIERGLSPFLPFLKTWLPLVVAFAAETAFGWDFVRDEWHAPAYFEQSNGWFQVAVIDRKVQQIVRYQGVFVGKDELPQPTPLYCPATVYAFSSRRPKNCGREDPWKAMPEDMFVYEKPQWPVTDQKPPLEARRLETGRVVLGFRCMGEFYVMTEMNETEIPAGTEIQEGFSGGIHPVAETAERDVLVKEWLGPVSEKEESK